MVPRPVSPAASVERAWMVVGGFLLLVIAILVGVLLTLTTVGRGLIPAGPGASDAFAYSQVRQAPPLDLVDQDGQPFSLASLRGQRILVFFGYTHCPDVCPATVGIVGQVLARAGAGTRAIFVTVDPERDTPAWLREYVRYLPKGFTALTGTAAQVRTAADAWGVRYARIDTGSQDGYSMAHTAEVYLVDADGRLRAHFPFGTEPEPMLAYLQTTRSSATISAGPPSPAPSVAPGAVAGTAAPPSTQAAAAGLRPAVVSTPVWAGGQSPVILSLATDAGPIADLSIRPRVQLAGQDGGSIGAVAEAVAVQPPGIAGVSYVAMLDIPQPGTWRVEVTAAVGDGVARGSAELTALDPGSTPQLGAAAPDVHTPTLADVGGDGRLVTTDPAPDLRLSERSTSDARAAGVPYVLVIDSYRFRVSSACGRAIAMARYLGDRWPTVAFIHLEPYRYSLVTDTAVLDGDLADPPLTPVAAAWGIGSGPWDSRAMPWAFVVDGRGIVVAKYEGVIGSDDIDVVLSLIATGGR